MTSPSFLQYSMVSSICFASTKFNAGASLNTVLEILSNNLAAVINIEYIHFILVWHRCNYFYQGNLTTSEPKTHKLHWTCTWHSGSAVWYRKRFNIIPVLICWTNIDTVPVYSLMHCNCDSVYTRMTWCAWNTRVRAKKNHSNWGASPNPFSMSIELRPNRWLMTINQID